MFQFIKRFVRQFRKPKAKGPSYWTDQELAVFDDMIEGYETLGRLAGSMADRTTTTESGRTITFRPLNAANMVVKPSILPRTERWTDEELAAMDKKRAKNPDRPPFQFNKINWPIDVKVVFDENVFVNHEPDREAMLYGPKSLKEGNHGK